MLNVTDGVAPRVALKRHISSSECRQETKRRIVDNLSNLSLSGNWVSSSDGTMGERRKSGSPGLFGSDSGLLSNPQNMFIPQKNNDDEPIIINSIDDFLRRNPDSNDFLGNSIADYNNIDMDKIFIPNLTQLSDIYILDPMNKRQAFSYDRIFARKSKQKALNNDQTPIEITNSEIYYDQYILEKWSLVKWYDPSEVLCTNLKNWYIRKQARLEELERTDFNMTDESDDVYAFHGKQQQQLRQTSDFGMDGQNTIDYNTWTSGYGSYYQSPNSFSPDNPVPMPLDEDEMDID